MFFPYFFAKCFEFFHKKIRKNVAKLRPKKAYFFEPGLGHPGLSKRSLQAKISQLPAVLAELDLVGAAQVLGLGFWFWVSEKSQVKTPP